MKNTFISLFMIFILCVPFSVKADPIKLKTAISLQTIESLFIGLNTQNLGLKTSSAFMLGELKITSAVVPLMKMLRNSESDEAKIVAALALYKLGTPMSIHSLYQASRFDESERVKKMCLRFYLNFISNNKSIES